MIEEESTRARCSWSSRRSRCSRPPAATAAGIRRAERGRTERGSTERRGSVRSSPERRCAVQDRLLERRRRRQRLPRGAGLHGEGRGARRSGQVVRAHHHPPQHRRGRSAAGHPRPDRRGRRRDRLQPERARRPQPGARRGEGRRHQDRVGRRVRDRSGHLQPVQQPGSSTRTSAPSGCSSSSAARATSGTRAASPATRPTPTATPASRRRSPRTPASRSSRVPRRPHRLGSGQGHPARQRVHLQRRSTTTIQGIWTSGMDSAGRRRRQGRRASRTCRSSARTSARSSASCSTRPTTRASRAPR